MDLRNIFTRNKLEEEKPLLLQQGEGFSEQESVLPVKKPIDDKAVRKATEILNKYKAGKAHLEQRIIANEEFWKMRQWSNGVGGARVENGTKQYNVNSTPWLHSCVESRHADTMDSYPTCNFLPRQQDDEAEAKRLASIVPVILAQNDFEETYSDVARYTLKQGGGVYGVFWDASAHNGLGDIGVAKVDLINLFWEPGINDLQKSANVFLTSLVDNKLLEQRYHQTKNKLGGKGITIARYLYDDTVNTDDKSVVVDWYYHTEYNGKRVLHYCKYVNDIVLFASENEPQYAEGYYHHGMYPFVGQSLYPVEGTPFGYGLTDIGRATQLQIDLLNKAIVDNATEGARPRYMQKNGSGINAEEFNDPTQRIVHVEGPLDEDHLRPIVTADLPSIYVTFYNNKIEELKYCTANQDANNGVAPSGVTAASALAALAETAGKNARNSNKAFHRAYKEVIYQVVELMRQFYDQPRMFRIAADAVRNEYMVYTNQGLVPQQQTLAGADMGFRKPEFDIDVTVEKENPYQRMEHNELMLQFYNLGIFNPQNAEVSISLLENMDFDGKQDLIDQVRMKGSMFQTLLQFQQLALELAKQSDPALAERIAQAIMQTDQGLTAQMGVGITANNGELMPNLEEEHPFVEKSRAQVRESTQPR